MSQLDQKLLNDLEQYYDQVALMWIEGIPFDEATERLQISYEQLEDMHMVMFNEHPIYRVKRNGEWKTMQLNVNTMQSKEIKDVNETL